MTPLCCNIGVFVEVAEVTQVSREICDTSQLKLITLFKLLGYIYILVSYFLGLLTRTFNHFSSRNVSIYHISQYLGRKGETYLDLHSLLLRYNRSS